MQLNKNRFVSGLLIYTLFLLFSSSVVQANCAPCGECNRSSLKGCSYVPETVKPKVRHKKKSGCYKKKPHKPVAKVAKVIRLERGCGIGCKEPPMLVEKCEPITQNIIRCPLINPADLVDSTCATFIAKLRTCEPFICQAPYVRDPSIKTKWQIHGRVGNRCVISNTTEDMGIKNEEGRPIPITQTCEYDNIGMIALMKRFADMEKEYFHFTTCEHNRGVYNCTFSAKGKTIEGIQSLRHYPH